MYNYKYFIVGNSGSGKSTIVNKYNKKYGTSQVLSYTTRPIRACERKNPTHTHVSVDEFKSLSGMLVSYDRINGYDYGITEQQLLDNDFFVVNLEGIKVINKMLPNLKYKFVYILTHEGNCITRMFNRGDSEQSIKERIVNEHKQFDVANNREPNELCKDLIDVCIDNNSDINYAIENLHSYIEEAEKEFIEETKKGKNKNV